MFKGNTQIINWSVNYLGLSLGKRPIKSHDKNCLKKAPKGNEVIDECPNNFKVYENAQMFLKFKNAQEIYEN